MVSEADSFLTRLFSSFIFITEKASEIVTASGSPSGTATTIIEIAIIRKFIKFPRVVILIRYSYSVKRIVIIILIVIAMNVRAAA
jgi:hypothetical protein